MNGLNSRQIQILETVKQNGNVTINSLIDKVGASPATVRKDVALLASLELVYRARGEVHAANGIPSNVIYRKNANQTAKQRIAYEAVKHIREGDTIILDSGSTSLELAKLLLQFHSLTVITFSLDIANVLQASNLNLIVVGGQYSKVTSSFIGPEAVNFFSNIRAQKYFLTASGIRENSGLTVYNSMEGEIKKAAISAATQVTAIIDSSKVNNACIYQFATFENIDTLITDDAYFTDSLKKSLESKNVSVIVTHL